jgi:hypothetical protein
MQITITTTRSRAEAMSAHLAHDHIPYGDKGREVKGFLDDIDAALETVQAEEHTDEEAREARRLAGVE